MEPISIEQVARILEAEVVGQTKWSINGVTTDTRQPVERTLFFALRGAAQDGHGFVKDAFAKGAAAAVVDREIAGAGTPQLIIPDTLEALGDLAKWYRDQFSIPVVGVTGSVGKTSTKEMIAFALRARYNVLANEKNFNNEIGLPLTLFNLDRSHEVAVLEMGMRGSGQIERLAGIARPTIGVITNIGLSHIEILGSRDRIAAAKAELLTSLDVDGTAVINIDDDYAGYLMKQCKGRVITYGVDAPADFRATNIQFSNHGSPHFEVNGVKFSIKTTGVHHPINAAAACAVTSTLNISLEEVASQLEHFTAPTMRGEALAGPDGSIILNDTYNAAPDSMRSALHTLRVIGAGQRRTVAILGDMKELGDQTVTAHGFIGEVVMSEQVDVLVTVGEAAMEIARVASSSLGSDRIHQYSDTETAVNAVPELIQSGDVVLVKGSRAMEMERIVEVLTRERTTL